MQMSQYTSRVKCTKSQQLDMDAAENDIKTPQRSTITTKSMELKNGSDVNSNSSASSGSLLGSSTKTSTSAHNFYMLPMRSSELPTLESDSEEEENDCKSVNLDCAILNDSFIISPVKTEPEDSTTITENEPHATGNLSFILRFDKMGLKSHKKDMNTNNAQLSQKPAEVMLASSQKRSQQQQQQLSTKTVIAETPLRPYNSDLPIASSSSSVATNVQFATPQVGTQPLQKRATRDYSALQTNEFRSQKVLFQTPLAIARPPLIPDDSISLSLCDTITENTPAEIEKAKEDVAGSSKSKKSLEHVFERFESQANKENSTPAPSDKPVKATSTSVANKCTPAPAASTTATTAAAAAITAAGGGGSKSSVLQINGVDYVIGKKLGCGGSSSVYLARRKDSSEEVALKVVDLHGDPAVVEGYLNETKLLAKLQGNVCVVSLYDYQLLQKESRLFLVMEKGDSDLHKILQSYTTNLPLYVLMNFLYQMLQAVNYIHENGVIHSDLKPANFLMIDGRLKLIDFGIASNISIDSTSIIKFSQGGTFNYISPEALTDTSTGLSPMKSNQPKIKISTKSDVWSLGCILYLLLYKKTPFSHIKNVYTKMNAISNPSTVIDYPAIPVYYPAMLVYMVKSCLQHNPKKRPSCAELLKYPFNMVIPIQNLTVPSKKS